MNKKTNYKALQEAIKAVEIPKLDEPEKPAKKEYKLGVSTPNVEPGVRLVN